MAFSDDFSTQLDLAGLGSRDGWTFDAGALASTLQVKSGIEAVSAHTLQPDSYSVDDSQSYGSDVFAEVELLSSASGGITLQVRRQSRFVAIELRYTGTGPVGLALGEANGGWTAIQTLQPQFGVPYRVEAEGTTLRLFVNGIEHGNSPWTLVQSYTGGICALRANGNNIGDLGIIDNFSCGELGAPPGLSSEVDTAWRVQALADQSTAWRIAAASDQSTAWRIQAASDVVTSWRIQIGQTLDTAWRILSAGASSISTAWRIQTAVEQDTSWRIKTANTLDTAWQIFGLSVSTLATAWRIKAASDQPTSWRIKAASALDTAWRVAVFQTLNTAWRIGLVSTRPSITLKVSPRRRVLKTSDRS